MVGFDEDTSDEDITEEEIRASKNLLHIDFKRYEKPYGKASNKGLDEVLDERPDEESANGFKSYLVSRGKYEGRKDVIGMLRASPDKKNITLFVYLTDQQSNSIYFVQGDIFDDTIRVKYFVRTNGEFNKEAKDAWTKENIIDAAGLAAYLEETLHGLRINRIDLSSMEETKNEEMRNRLRKILKVLGNDYNIEII